jgi:E3 ubiquitin-protein ligase TRIP12
LTRDPSELTTVSQPNGRNIPVTSENVEEYITGVIEAILGQGARLQAKAFREGFSKVFPITDLQAFALDELVMLFGNAEEDWSIESERSSYAKYAQTLILVLVQR